MGKKKSGYTKKTTDWLGRKKLEHFNADKKKIGETRFTTNWLGKTVQKHVNLKGEEIGRTKKGSDWLGRDRAEHFRGGKKVGYSRNDTDWLGRPVQRHYDNDRKEVGTTRRGEDWLGRRRGEHTGEFYKASATTDTPINSLPNGRGGTADYRTSSGGYPSGANSLKTFVPILLLCLAGSVIYFLTRIPLSNLGRGTHVATTSPAVRYVSTAYVNTKNLNLRSGAGANYSAVQTLPKGTQVAVADEQKLSDGNIWVRVRVGSLEGWVNKKFLSQQQEEVTGVAREQTAPKTVASGNERQIILETMNSLADAFARNDYSTLNHLLADDYTENSPSGEIIGKNTVLNTPRAGTDYTLKYYDLQVTVSGDTAKVRGRFTSKFTIGTEYHTYNYPFEDLLTKRTGHWQVSSARISY